MTLDPEPRDYWPEKVTGKNRFIVLLSLQRIDFQRDKHYLPPYLWDKFIFVSTNQEDFNYNYNFSY